MFIALQHGQLSIAYKQLWVHIARNMNVPFGKQNPSKKNDASDTIKWGFQEEAMSAPSCGRGCTGIGIM